MILATRCKISCSLDRFKNEELRCSLDFLQKLETSFFNAIIADFNKTPLIHLYSDKCGPKEYQKYEESIRRGNKRANITDFMSKKDKNPTTSSSLGDTKLLS
jgi:abortive infection bacteriophage resistance protein